MKKNKKIKIWKVKKLSKLDRELIEIAKLNEPFRKYFDQFRNG